MSDAEGPQPAPFRKDRYWLVLALILLFAAWPLVPAALANVVAAANHCGLVEAGPQPCPVGGSDWGGPLWSMASLVKIVFFTLPAGATLLFFWLLALIVGLTTYARRQAGSNAPRLEHINFLWYALALAVILAVAYMVLSGVLPGILLFLVIFAAIFWLFSFAFALYSTLRRSRSRP